MKIALVCPYNMFDKVGGVQTLVMELADGLRKRKHEVKIITPRPFGFKGVAPKDYILLGTSTKFGAGIGTTGTWTYDIDGKAAKRVLAREKFDVINFHEPWAPILARQLLPLSKAAHVGTFHANLSDNQAAKYLVNLFLPYGRGIGEKLHMITAPSVAGATVLLNKDPGHRLVKNIRYIPNGINTKLYRPLKKRTPLSGADTKTIVYVGRLEKRKGVEWLIKAFAELQREMPEAYLLIAGQGAQKSKLEQQVATQGIANVNFLGFVSDEQKRHLMGNADVFCAPAMYGESFGIVIIEAMAMGAPVIAGNNLGFESVLTGRGRLGLIDSEATADFANRLSVFLNDETINRLSRDWSLKEIKKYDYAKILDMYEEAFRQALQQQAALLNGSGAHGKKPNNRKVFNRLFVRRHAR